MRHFRIMKAASAGVRGIGWVYAELMAPEPELAHISFRTYPIIEPISPTHAMRSSAIAAFGYSVAEITDDPFTLHIDEA